MNKALVLSLILGLSTAGCKESAHPARFTIKLTNDVAQPLAAYPVQIGTFSYWKPGEGFGTDIWVKEIKSTDDSGMVVFDYASKTGEFGINFSPGLPKGYYVTRIPNYKFNKVAYGRWTPENPVIEVTLRRIKNPIPMYAKNLTNEGGGLLGIPAAGKDLAYDFEVGDWLAPYGKGKTGDIVFFGLYEEDAAGNSQKVVKITFPGKEDGLIVFDRDPWKGSELRSDHEAPEQGYQPAVTLVQTVIENKMTDDARRDRNYYFRVRSKLDEDGNIISANYGKIYGDFMSFIYYFNPTPNDRNVEFDPSRNLLKIQGVYQEVLIP